MREFNCAKVFVEHNKYLSEQSIRRVKATAENCRDGQTETSTSEEVRKSSSRVVAESSDRWSAAAWTPYSLSIYAPPVIGGCVRVDRLVKTCLWSHLCLTLRHLFVSVTTFPALPQKAPLNQRVRTLGVCRIRPFLLTDKCSYLICFPLFGIYCQIFTN